MLILKTLSQCKGILRVKFFWLNGSESFFCVGKLSELHVVRQVEQLFATIFSMEDDLFCSGAELLPKHQDNLDLVVIRDCDFFKAKAVSQTASTAISHIRRQQEPLHE